MAARVATTVSTVSQGTRLSETFISASGVGRRGRVGWLRSSVGRDVTGVRLLRGFQTESAKRFRRLLCHFVCHVKRTASRVTANLTASSTNPQLIDQSRTGVDACCYIWHRPLL